MRAYCARTLNETSESVKRFRDSALSDFFHGSPLGSRRGKKTADPRQRHEHDLRRKLLAFVFPALLAPVTFVACSGGSNDEQVVYVYADGGKPTQGQDGSSNNQGTDGALKPSRRKVDASNVVDATHRLRTKLADASKPTGAGDAGKLDAAALQDASPPPVTGDGDPLDPIDESLMPDYGFDEHTCADYDLTKDTGRCYNDIFNGADYVEEDASRPTPTCSIARATTPPVKRARSAQDDGNYVGCVLIDVAPSRIVRSKPDRQLHRSRSLVPVKLGRLRLLHGHLRQHLPRRRGLLARLLDLQRRRLHLYLRHRRQRQHRVHVI